MTEMRRFRGAGSRRITERILPVLVILALAGAAVAAEDPSLSIDLGTAYFWPRDDVFKEIYGGGPAFGIGLAVPLVDGLQAWAGAAIFQKRGQIIFTGETTTLRTVPVFGGLRYQLAGRVLRPYAGLAMTYHRFKEESAWGVVRGKGFGVLGQAGCEFSFGRAFGLDVHGRFTACRGKPDIPEAVAAEIGGFEFGAGLVFRFW